MKGTQQALYRRLFDELITATHPRLTPSSRVRRIPRGPMPDNQGDANPESHTSAMDM